MTFERSVKWNVLAFALNCKARHSEGANSARSVHFARCTLYGKPITKLQCHNCKNTKSLIQNSKFENAFWRSGSG